MPSKTIQRPKSTRIPASLSTCNAPGGFLSGKTASSLPNFLGSRGGAAFHNVNGSFYDFVAERYEGTKRVHLVSPPDNWSGRAALEWVGHLQANEHFDVRNGDLVRVAEVLETIYQAI
jgi:hypothetical protein